MHGHLDGGAAVLVGRGAGVQSVVGRPDRLQRQLSVAGTVLVRPVVQVSGGLLGRARRVGQVRQAGGVDVTAAAAAAAARGFWEEELGVAGEGADRETGGTLRRRDGLQKLAWQWRIESVSGGGESCSGSRELVNQTTSVPKFHFGLGVRGENSYVKRG